MNVERQIILLKPFFRSLRLLSRTESVRYFALLILRILVNALDVLALIAVGFLGAMVATGFQNAEDGEFLGFRFSIAGAQSYFYLVVAIVALFLAKSVLALVLLRLVSFHSAKIEARISSEVATLVFGRDLRDVSKLSMGDLQFALTVSPNYATTVLLTSGTSLISEGALFLSVLFVFVLVEPLNAFLITAYFAALLAFFQSAVNARLKRLGSNLAESAVSLTNTIQELSVNFRELVAYGKVVKFLDKFSDLRMKYALDNARVLFLGGFPRSFFEVALVAGVFLLLIVQFTGQDPAEGLASTSVFLAGGIRIMGSLLPLQSALANIRTYGPRALRAQELAEEARGQIFVHPRHPAEENQKGAKEMKTLASEVVFEQVSHSYTNGSRRVLDNVSFKVERGQFVAIIGPSGAGKSTIADLIVGVQEPREGIVLLDGLSPKDFIRSSPSNIGLVPQEPGLVHGTIAQNIALGVDKEYIDRHRVTECMVQVGLEDYLANLGSGIDSLLGEQLDTMSGGQKQRLGLARALYRNPSLLILDEATSALDAATELMVMNAVMNLGSSCSVIAIAHRLSTVKHADKIFVVDGGRIVASGTLPELKRSSRLVRDYIELLSLD